MNKQYCNNQSTCKKGGVKIHNSNTNYLENPVDFYNKLKTQNKPTGVRISQSENEYKDNPFGNVNPFNNVTGEKEYDSIKYDKTSYNTIDLNIDNYSRNDLFNLFGIKTMSLTEEIMKESKKTVLKTHPDKSKLEPKYFLFFSTAYKRLFTIYEFQNKTVKKENDSIEYHNKPSLNNNDTNKLILDKMFEQDKSLNDKGNFNKWFNDQFDKYKLEDNENGYGDWLKSDEDIVSMGNVSQANMASEIEKRKKIVQSLTTYTGVNTMYSDSSVGTSLMDSTNNFTSGMMFSNEGMGFTDLRQAYVESVIPVTEDDYNKIQKFKNVDEYKRHRDSTSVNPINKEDAMRQLYKENKQKDEESAALAYYYAEQSEKTKKNEDTFWSSIKKITNN